MAKIVIVHTNNKAIYTTNNEPLNLISQSNNQRVEANLIASQLVPRKNLDNIFIDTAHFSKEQIYIKD